MHGISIRVPEFDCRRLSRCVVVVVVVVDESPELISRNHVGLVVVVVIASHIGFPRNLVYIDNHIGLVVVLVVIAERLSGHL